MTKTSGRDRTLAAYASEVRAFHLFFAAVLLVLAYLHLFVLLPFVQLRSAAPALAAAVSQTEAQIAAADDAQKAVAASTAALDQFRRALDAAPDELRRAIGNLVARGSVAASGTDPYKATITVPRTGGAPGQGGDEAVTVEEAIRREIGRQTEALASVLDSALEPLRRVRPAPVEIEDALGAAQGGVGRHVLVLNEVLREAFASDPAFWQRLNGPGLPFAAASARSEQVATALDQAVHSLERSLADAAVGLRSRRNAQQARLAILAARQREQGERLALFTARTAWIPLAPDAWARIYPLVAAGLALTVLLRMRRILLLRGLLGAADPDAITPSWIAGPLTTAGRWWALVVVALPLLAAIHAWVAVLSDPGLFSTVLGEPSPAMRLGFGAAYAVLTVVGVIQFASVARGLLD
ncbi:MAG: hypothetical protein QN168_09195 [Armatimonadota bacterium]|nr:hypothetical protein [Armatimonadota bacterium]